MMSQISWGVLSEIASCKLCGSDSWHVFCWGQNSRKTCKRWRDTMLSWDGNKDGYGGQPWPDLL